MKKLVVKKSAVKKLLQFNPWVYQNEIAMLPEGVEEGELVEVVDLKQQFYGIGYVNIKSVITLRMMSFKNEKIDGEWIKEKIHQALIQRNHILGHTNSCRLVHADADGLPGLMMDFYDGVVTLAINTAGMERFREEIIQAVIALVKPTGIYEKSDANARTKEGLETKEGVLYGDVPAVIEVVEYGCGFALDLRNAQKTGFYLDQRFNHGLMTEYIDETSEVLDLFCNVGGFGMHALNAGAKHVTFVDVSKEAIASVKKNMELNEFDETRGSCIAQNAMDYIQEAANEGKQFDVVVLDPPSFAKTKEQAQGAISGFKHLMKNGIKVCKDDGYIALFSCSYHVGLEELLALSLEASAECGVQLRVIEHLYQDKDHPYILNIPNSLYLKGLLFQVV